MSADPVDLIPGLTSDVDEDDVGKAEVRAEFKALARRFADAATVNATDCSGRDIIFIGAALFEKDTENTDDDDGLNVVHDVGGISFLRAGGPIGDAAVTQATDKSTGVELDGARGAITMHAASLAAATIVSFTLTNAKIAANDVLALNHLSGGTPGAYTLNARCAAGAASIDLRNNTAGALAEAIVIQFALVKAPA